MIKTLILMRHAKSSWSTPGLDDHDRPLNSRGHRSALALGDWLRAEKHLPDSVICSSALRTRQTLEGLAISATTLVTDRLYHASAEQMFNALIEAETDCVLMLGHNPGIADFAQRLVAAPPDHPRFDDYPTGATLVAEFRVPLWSDIQWKQARTTAFITPRELTE